MMAATVLPPHALVRSRRKREVRAQTVSMKRLPKRELELGAILNPPLEGVARPRTRAECVEGERPCPFVSCAHHLYLDVSKKTGAVKLNFPDLEVDELAESCALDVADGGGATLEEVGALVNVTRERIRQIETTTKARLRVLLRVANVHADDFEEPSMRSADLLEMGAEGGGGGVAPKERPTGDGGLWTGDGLRRLVSRRYEVRLVERGLAQRPGRPGRAPEEEDEEGDEDEGRSPRVDALPAMTSELYEELESWLGRVVLVDGEKRFRATELGRGFANAWRRAGGEPPLPVTVLRLVPPVEPRSPIEGTAACISPPLPPSAAMHATVPSANDRNRREDGMALTEKQQAVVDTKDLSAQDAAAKTGMSVAAVYAMRSSLKRAGALTGASKAEKPKRAPRKGGGRKVEERGERDAELSPDEELLAPLRAALAKLDERRSRLLTAMTALGWEA